MAVCIDTGTAFGLILQRATETTLGDLMLLMLFIFMACMALAAMLSIPMEFTAILLVPLTIGFMVCTSQYNAAGGALLIYIAFLYIKNLPFR